MAADVEEGVHEGDVGHHGEDDGREEAEGLVEAGGLVGEGPEAEEWHPSAHDEVVTSFQELEQTECPEKEGQEE